MDFEKFPRFLYEDDRPVKTTLREFLDANPCRELRTTLLDFHGRVLKRKTMKIKGVYCDLCAKEIVDMETVVHILGSNLYCPSCAEKYLTEKPGC